MKAYLWISGTIFALFAAWQFVTAYNRFVAPGDTFRDGLGPALIGLAGGALAGWAMALRRVADEPGDRGR